MTRYRRPCQDLDPCILFRQTLGLGFPSAVRIERLTRAWRGLRSGTMRIGVDLVLTYSIRTSAHKKESPENGNVSKGLKVDARVRGAPAPDWGELVLIANKNYALNRLGLVDFERPEQ